MSQPSSSPALRKASAVIGWYPTTPATEQSIISMANARQVALRDRLRHHYWLTECKPLTAQAVELERRRMAMIDPQDTLTDEQTAELLSVHYGFARDALGGWSIPDLEAHYGTAVGAILGKREQASRAGTRSAAVRATAKAPKAAPLAATVEAVPSEQVASAHAGDADEF